VGCWQSAVEGVAMNPDFWRGRKVLLTGHTGFKGGWLSLWLQLLGARVIGYSLPPSTQPNLFDAARVAEGMRSVTGDVRNLNDVTKALAEHAPEVVIHMAAQPLVRFSYRHPVETYTTNVMGTVNVLEAVRRCHSVRVVVNVTSDKCYEDQGWIWGYREDERLGGYDPYASSKGCAELVTAAYRRSFFASGEGTDAYVAVATARAGNVIGGGDWAEDRLIPDIVRAMQAGRPVVIRNPKAVRPWQHVLEPLCGYLLLAEKLWQAKGASFAEGWNFGPDDKDTQSVQRIVDNVTRLWGTGATWKPATSPQPHETGCLRLDSSKAKAELGWSPSLSLSEALAWTIEWYRTCQAGGDMRKVTEQQISDFMRR
jgi:CDP-glucose 4,6-dehydratase